MNKLILVQNIEIFMSGHRSEYHYEELKKHAFGFKNNLIYEKIDPYVNVFVYFYLTPAFDIHLEYKAFSVVNDHGQAKVIETYIDEATVFPFNSTIARALEDLNIPVETEEEASNRREFGLRTEREEALEIFSSDMTSRKKDHLYLIYNYYNSVISNSSSGSIYVYLNSVMGNSIFLYESASFANTEQGAIEHINLDKEDKY